MSSTPGPYEIQIEIVLMNTQHMSSLTQNSQYIFIHAIPYSLFHFYSFNGSKLSTAIVPTSITSLHGCLFFIFTTVNIATGKAAKQSSTVGSAEAGLATDGNYEATTATDMCAVTESEGFPWWRVDLARTYDVARVDVSGCSDCNSKSTVYLLLAGIR